MTALDNSGKYSMQGRGSRVSPRRSRKRLLATVVAPSSSDISPAPEPRTSHRFRTNSTGDSTDDWNKVMMLNRVI